MFKLLRLFVQFFFVFVLLAVSSGSASAAPQAKWTVMVYISGDNDLEPYVVSDLETELGAVGSSENVQVVALADRIAGNDTRYGDWQTTKLFHVTQGMKADATSAVADWGEKDMADPQTLIDFVTWSKTNYPADHYVLYFWGHGWNWHPGYVMRDDTNVDTMDYSEQKTAIPSLDFVDVVGYDGCNMSSIEIFDLWHGYATAVTSSQEFVFSEGIQYDLVLGQLTANPNMTADQLAIATSQSASKDKTWSAVAVDDRFDALLTAVDEWSVALNDGLASNRKKYDRAFGATRTFWRNTEDKDLYDMAYEMNRLVSDSNIKSKSQAVMDAVNAVVLHERHVNGLKDAHGISIYHISKAGEKNTNYAYYRSTVDFALQTGWDEFLNAYVGSGKK
jgi:hypothetical protein